MRMVYGWTWWFFEVDSAAAFAAAFDVAALPVGTIVMYRCNHDLTYAGVMRMPEPIGKKKMSALFPAAKLYHALYNCGKPSALHFLREAFPSYLTSPSMPIPPSSQPIP